MCSIRINSFGDAWDLLSLVGGEEPVSDRKRRVTLGAFKIPADADRRRLRGLRREISEQCVRMLRRNTSSVLVIALDATALEGRSGLTGFGKDIAGTVFRQGRVLSGHDVPVVAVLVRSPYERELLVKAVAGGRFGSLGGRGWTWAIMRADELAHSSPKTLMIDSWL